MWSVNPNKAFSVPLVHELWGEVLLHVVLEDEEKLKRGSRASASVTGVHQLLHEGHNTARGPGCFAGPAGARDSPRAPEPGLNRPTVRTLWQ